MVTKQCAVLSIVLIWCIFILNEPVSRENLLNKRCMVYIISHYSSFVQFLFVRSHACTWSFSWRSHPYILLSVARTHTQNNSTSTITVQMKNVVAVNCWVRLPLQNAKLRFEQTVGCRFFFFFFLYFSSHSNCRLYRILNIRGWICVCLSRKMSAQPSIAATTALFSHYSPQTVTCQCGCFNFCALLRLQ